MGRGLLQFLGETIGRLVVVRLQHPQIPVANRARQFEHSQDGSHARDTFVPGVVEMQVSIIKSGSLLPLYWILRCFAVIELLIPAIHADHVSIGINRISMKNPRNGGFGVVPRGGIVKRAIAGFQRGLPEF